MGHDVCVNLLEPLVIGTHEAPSRVVLGPHETNLGERRAISERHVAYYRRRAAGGAGVVTVEEASVHDSDWPYERAPLAADCSPGWAAVADVCHAEGALVLGDQPATRVVDDACIFLNRPGFEGGVGCALHIAALAAGERPLDWKPNVCWQVPIRLEHDTDDRGHVTSRLREWKRRDWGEGGAEFHWWCTEAPEAFSGREPVYRASRDEIVELVGQPVYELLVTQRVRPDWVPRPPTVK